MMFVVRGDAPSPPEPVPVKATRNTPAIIANAAGKKDYFCVGTAEDITTLRAAGWEIVELRDGWYEDDSGGGIAIFGHGKYWEVRDTPFTVKESCGLAAPPADPGPEAAAGEQVNVRGAVFGV